MTTTTFTPQRIRAWWEAWIAPVYAWLLDFTRGEKLLLVAVLCFGAVGADAGHSFFTETRGDVVGWIVSLGIEALYLGAAGMAVKLPRQRLIAQSLMFIGAGASAFFGMVDSLKMAVPMLFAPVPIWPSVDQWVVFGMPAVIGGVIPALAALLLALLLHNTASHRLMDEDSKQAAVQSRRDMKPFACPFCSASFDSAPKLYGHSGRCDDASGTSLTDNERKAIIQQAVAEGKCRIIEG